MESFIAARADSCAQSTPAARGWRACAARGWRAGSVWSAHESSAFIKKAPAPSFILAWVRVADEDIMTPM